MINEITQQQSKNIKTDYQYIDDYHIVIEKYKEIIPVIQKTYILELEDYIINPSDTFTLADNWNGGIIPKNKYLCATIINIIGKMIKVDACGYDLASKQSTSDTYEGLWLPLGGIHLIQELN